MTTFLNQSNYDYTVFAQWTVSAFDVTMSNELFIFFGFNWCIFSFHFGSSWLYELHLLSNCWFQRWKNFFCCPHKENTVYSGEMSFFFVWRTSERLSNEWCQQIALAVASQPFNKLNVVCTLWSGKKSTASINYCIFGIFSAFQLQIAPKVAKKSIGFDSNREENEGKNLAALNPICLKSTTTLLLPLSRMAFVCTFSLSLFVYLWHHRCLHWRVVAINVERQSCKLLSGGNWLVMNWHFSEFAECTH